MLQRARASPFAYLAAAIIASPRRLQTARRFPFSHTKKKGHLSPVRARLAPKKLGNHRLSVLRDIVESVPVSLVIAPL